MAVLASAIHLLVQAFLLEVEKMSTSLLALGVGLAVVLVKIKTAYRAGKWPAVMAELRQDTWKGAAVALALWAALFLVFLGAAIFQDHTGLVRASKDLRKKVETCQTDSVVVLSQIQSRLESANKDVAVKDGINQTLQSQNRDQQSTINHCFSEAMKLLTPEPLHIAGVAFENEPVDVTTTRVRWLIITNKTVTPARINASCNGDLLTADASIAGSTAMLGRAAMVSARVVAIDINSPPLSPTSPIIFTMTFKNSPTMGCNFYLR